MGIYIHIPFCNRICSYCDFPKVLKNDNWIDSYLKSLKKEINQKYKGEEISTIYIGGGTPISLNINQLNKLFEITNIFNLSENAEITIEVDSEDLTIEKIKYLKENVNRISIGIETFDKKRLKELNRTVNIKNIKEAFKYFDNINLDLMYGFKNQSIKDLETDLDKIIELNPNHISTYSLIIEPNTKLYIENYQRLDDDSDRKMYDLIIKKLKKHNYIHYETSNFSKPNYESKHNLTYWNNEKYYGFGLGAGGYIENIRYENTRSLNKYIEGNYELESHELSKEEKVQNELILGFRKTKGINKQKFKEKYEIDIKDFKDIEILLKQKVLKENKKYIYIDNNYQYISNEILVRFINLTLP